MGVDLTQTTDLLVRSQAGTKSQSIIARIQTPNNETLLLSETGTIELLTCPIRVATCRSIVPLVL